MSDALRAALADAARQLGADGVDFVLERPRDTGHGDLATNLAMQIARQRKQNPRAVATELLAALQVPPSLVSKSEIAGPGFINFWLAQDALAAAHAAILTEGAGYGRSTTGAGVRVNVEFVSANPTGPLHVGHGRGAALGDAIASLLEWTGHAVTREFYINDAGVQITRLAESLWARVQQAAGREAAIPEGGYHGEYLREMAQEVLAAEGPHFAELGPEGLARCRELALAMMRVDQDRDLADFGVRFDVLSSEQSLYDRAKVLPALERLKAAGHAYEQDGALFLRTTAFGDDKDRVLRKSDGTYTYFVPDIAYHLDKHERGFQRAIDIWGADHHGYKGRVRAALLALGLPETFFDVEFVQLVKVMRGGEEVRMSKRSGEFVTLRDLVGEVGRDAARYFFLMRDGNSQLVFDVDLALKRTDENPIFYVQMAHARLSGIFRTAGRTPDSVTGTLDLSALTAPEDLELLKVLPLFPEVVARAAEERAPHRVIAFLHERLARSIHGWYHHTRTVGEPEPVETARLLLARAARTVLANGLHLLGLSAPDRM